MRNLRAVRILPLSFKDLLRNRISDLRHIRTRTSMIEHVADHRWVNSGAKFRDAESEGGVTSVTDFQPLRNETTRVDDFAQSNSSEAFEALWAHFDVTRWWSSLSSSTEENTCFKDLSPRVELQRSPSR